jgi:Uma2 family endonuclease
MPTFRALRPLARPPALPPRRVYARHVSTARRLHHTYEDYLRALELSAIKLEFCDGEMYAMAGGTPAHADLAASMTRLLGNALLGRCRVSSSDLKVRIETTDLSTFPDVSVVCGSREVAAIDPNAVTNPTLLVEMTSNSTEDYDRGDKLGHYKQLPSLAAVMFVSHRRPQVTVVARTSSGWEEREHRAGETVTLASPSVTFAVDELYAGIELDAR